MTKYIILALSLALLACSSAGNSKSRDESGENTYDFTYSQSACFGACPVFSVKLHNKALIYAGLKNTQLIGNYTSELSDEELESFHRLVQESSILKDTTREEYDMMITDLPYKTLVISKSKDLLNNSKQLTFRRNPPKKYSQIIDFILNICSEHSRWESDK
jgi:hypothetical protein